MAILFPPNNMKYHHTNRFRRNATSVMAGAFDIRPPRDVLTSLLNGVGPYKAVERDEEARHKRKKEKRERERERKRLKAAARALHKAALLADSNQHASTDGKFASTSSLPQPIPTAPAATSSFWRARPTIHIPAIQRSVSVTPSPTSSPPPRDFTPGSTPDPSISSSTSRTSSKRPRTPADNEVIGSQSVCTVTRPSTQEEGCSKEGMERMGRRLASTFGKAYQSRCSCLATATTNSQWEKL